MKIKSTMTYNGEPIASCEWELDDRARTAQQALAAMSIEDHLRAHLEIEHKIVNEDKDESKKNESENVNEESETTDVLETSDTPEDGRSCDCSIQSDEGGELNGVDAEAEIDEGSSERDPDENPPI